MISLFSLSKSRQRVVLFAALVFIAIAGSATSTQAIPLSTYRERVRQATVLLSTLHSLDEEEDELSYDERVTQTLSETRRLLPPTDTVEWAGTTVQVDNKWLAAALERYEDFSNSSKDRAVILTETTTRLSALSEALAEAEKQQGTAGSSNKDDEKARMSAILRRSDYAKKAPEESAVARLWKRFMAWLRGLFPDRSPVGPGSAGALSTVAQIFVFGLALAILVFVVWKLWPRLWRRGGAKKKTKKREARVVLGERLEPDQSSADLLAEAEALAREGNLRAAIRKGYIALLCELGDRKVLGLAQHKTNRDYLRAVQSHEQLYREMKFLTFSFEHHWYGFLPATMEDWDVFRSRYQQALRQ